jgi:hypothetical protein
VCGEERGTVKDKERARGYFESIREDLGAAVINNAVAKAAGGL